MIAASLVQIYNEEVQDLLAPNGKKTVELQRSTTGFSIPSLTHCGMCTARYCSLGSDKLSSSARQTIHLTGDCHQSNAWGCRREVDW